MDLTNNFQVPSETLSGILEYLKKEQAAKERSREDHKLNGRRESFAQICSIYAVIAIFIATLGVGFLTYMHDTFVDRPAEIPAKITDHVVIMCLLLSVLLSIGSSIALGAGASPTLLLTLPSTRQDSIQELFGVLTAAGFPRSLANYILKWYYMRRQLNFDAQNGTITPLVRASNNVGRFTRRSRWDNVRIRFLTQPASIIRSWMSLSEGQKLPTTEFQFVIGMLLVALVCMTLSFICLATAIITFAWAELGRPVAIAVTVSLVFPFAVVRCVAIICRRTLFRRTMETKGHEVGAPEDMSLEQLRGENAV